MKELNFEHTQKIYTRGSTASYYQMQRRRINNLLPLERAQRKVRKAIKNGQLVSLKNNIVPCFYCGYRATIYEHRDYNKPLDVVPACRKCNEQLGSAQS